MSLLEGKVAIVTGAGKGLGRAFAVDLAKQGAKVVIVTRKDLEGLKKTYEQIEAIGGKALWLQVDVSHTEDLSRMVAETTKRFGRIDILVNNAGIGQVVPLALMEEEDWDRMMNTNVKGAFLTTQAVLRGMIHQKRGRILNISSLAGVKMMQAPVHYSASKAALKGMTEALAKEVGSYGITVNCLPPGVLNEGVSGNLPPAKQREYIGHCALGRLGTVEEIAEVVAFFVSDKNSYMNGATTVIDGGV